MATTVTDDRTVEVSGGDADTATGWSTHITLGGNVGIQNTDVIAAQGTGSQPMRVNGNGLGGLAHDLTATRDLSDLHIFIWAFNLQNYDTDANNGVIIGISDAIDGTTNIGAWTAGGGDTNIGNKNNFQSWCVDVHQPFSNTTGTPVALNVVRSIFLNWNFLTNNGRISAFIDQISRGTGITLTGGTSGVPGNSNDVTADDDTNGRGMFQNIGGVVFILGKVTIGDIATSSVSHFTDTGKVWNFEGQHVSATFHKIEFVGGTGAGSVHAATFGTQVGSGITADGSGGNTFQAGGDVPFRIEAIDSNITVSLFGCNMVNPTALKAESWRRVITEDISVPTFVDVTRDANDSLTTPVLNPFPATPANGDRFNMGSHERFSEASINVGTAGTAAYTLTWQYSTGGTAFTNLTDVTDGTNNLKTTGINTVTYSIPDDWAKGTVNGVSMYWIRAVHDGTTGGVRPVITSMTASMGGGVRLEQANATAVSGTWTNMDTVVIRNGAILRKITLVDSVAVAKNAALDLGSSDPTADTVRDITIIGANKAILLKKDVTGNVTYNFRNIKFAGNTKKLRVDFPAASTVTVNILDGGDPIANPGDIDNVNSSTINILNTVTLTVHVEDNNEANLQGAQVYLQKSTPTAFTSGSGNNAGDVDLVVTQTIDSDIPQAGTCIVFDKSLNVTLPYRFASHDGANTFSFPTAVTGAATSPGTSTALISTSTNFLTADIEEGDTVQNTSDNSFAVVDRIIDVDNIATSPLQGGTNNTWANLDGFSFHKLATTLVSAIDTVDVPLINGQTDVNGDISLSYNFGTNTNIFVRARKNSAEFATKFQPGRATGTIVSTGITVNITLQEDTVAV